jgi:hypothetical protein
MAKKRGMKNTAKYTIIQEKGDEILYRKKTEEEEAGEIKKCT